MATAVFLTLCFPFWHCKAIRCDIVYGAFYGDVCREASFQTGSRVGMNRTWRVFDKTLLVFVFAKCSTDKETSTEDKRGRNSPCTLATVLLEPLGLLWEHTHKWKTISNCGKSLRTTITDTRNIFNTMSIFISNFNYFLREFA